MPNLTIQFLDVGQGDGIYIEFPSGANMLVDLGSVKNKNTVNADVFKYFTDHTRFGKPGAALDYLIVTHPDRDHYNLISEFIKELKPKIGLYTFGGAYKDFSNKTWMSDVEGAGGKFFAFSSVPGKLVHPKGWGDKVEVWCLARTVDPKIGFSLAWRKNTNSVVLLINYDGAKVILAGDATIDTEYWILAQYQTGGAKLSDLQSHVLKVAHHGSARTSNSKQWISAVNPHIVFISSDRSGSLDINKRSGFRLPQELTIDIIRQYATNLGKDSEKHNYISSYNREEYDEHIGGTDKDFVNKKLTMPNPYKPTTIGWERAWYQIETKEFIYTTLAKMGGVHTNDDAEADEGRQFAVVIGSDGVIRVDATDLEGDSDISSS